MNLHLGPHSKATGRNRDACANTGISGSHQRKFRNMYMHMNRVTRLVTLENDTGMEAA